MSDWMDSRLRSTCIDVASWPLCDVLLKNDARFPWFILVPRFEEIVAFHELNLREQTQIFKEIRRLSTLVEKQFRPDRINIASIGNIVPQLHIHVIARYTTDAVWPNPVWGTKEEPYSAQALAEIVASVCCWSYTQTTSK